MFATVFSLDSALEAPQLHSTGSVADQFMLSVDQSKNFRGSRVWNWMGAGGVDPVQRMAEYLRH